MRRYQDEDDYWRIREFLRKVLLLNDRRQLSWHIARLDYWRWHAIENCQACDPVEAVTFIWETSDGLIAAVLNPEDIGQVFLQVHPNLRTLELEDELVAIAEKHLTRPGSDGKQKLWVWADAHDDLRHDVLTRRGYTCVKSPGEQEYQRRRPMSMPIPKAFHPNEPEERYEGWTWYHNVQRCPLYRRDLDIVAVASNGEFASFCTVWYDDATRTAYFEPVGTAPAHQRRGLGKAVMHEGLRRLERLGATLAFVSSYSPAAHALYASVGFTEYDSCEPWAKEF